ncbi:hypothetical protein BH23ACT6_BH23ACT6_07660 [soil metagenome]
MPTTRPRYQVTETPEVAHALDVAAKRWPNEPRSRLLLRLVSLGSGALEAQRQEAADAHRAAVLASSGTYKTVFEPDYLDRFREDWPG